ncbi:DUF5675 family protein [Limnovirga soli]|uniref:DUF5675 domain-containing protein n=1 Tax=Limnovirga soli TaxID=2656915 RepID=A0A8J8FDD4_9BACT|nr:DUF5675 family protein [Limnovirga soli]NNV54533.1 hypothetical protein [Limnovirga soli]
MELLLDRDVRTTDSTTGKLYINGKFECFILEDQDRELSQSNSIEQIVKSKVAGKTAIPAGRYKVIINQSARFKTLLPLLLNVPGFSGIRIHPGNTPADTEGCLLPGISRQSNKVIGSRIAFSKLFSKMQNANLQNEEIFITIQS